MPVNISGNDFYTTEEVLAEIDVSRQTLWRWRQDPDFPQGCKLRGRVLLFSEDELAEIRARAFRLEPVADDLDPAQLALSLGNSP